MRVRVAAAIAVASATSGLLAAGACGFPDPVLLEFDGAPRPTGDARLPDGALPGEDADTPGPDPDGGTGADADAATGCPKPCDCDDDGFLDVACDGGNDCDDNDRERKPDAGYRAVKPVAPATGDWNCDMNPEPEFIGSVNCTVFSPATCPSRRGFTGVAPGCGDPGAFSTCQVNGATGMCEANPSQVTQRCR